MEIHLCARLDPRSLSGAETTATTATKRIDYLK